MHKYKTLIKSGGKSLFLLFFGICSCHFLNAQNNQALYYKTALKYFKERNYQEADSFFTLSLRYFRDADSYYNRAICRKNLMKIEGYCGDLQIATMLDDKESKDLYLSSCGRIDTSYFSGLYQPATKSNYKLMEVSFVSNFSKNDMTYVYEKNGKVIGRYAVLDSLGKVYLATDLPARDPRSPSELSAFIRKNLVYPSDIKKLNKSVFVAFWFLIEEDGTLGKVITTKCSELCEPCITEARKLVDMLPNYKPATIAEKPVRSIGSFHVEFNIDRAYRWE